MTAVPASSNPGPIPSLINTALPRAIRDALIDSERVEFEQRYQEVMAEAARTLDLTEVLRMLAAWQDVARKTQEHGVDAHRRMLAQVEGTLTSGEPPAGSESWDQLSAKLGLDR